MRPVQGALPALLAALLNAVRDPRQTDQVSLNDASTRRALLRVYRERVDGARRIELEPDRPPVRAPMAYRVPTGVAEGGTSVVGMRAAVVLAEVIP